MQNDFSCYLVLLETSGNQHYIFSTNKLKENIGASELTYRVGTQFVLDAVLQLTNRPAIQFESVDRIRSWLLNPQSNPSIESPNTRVEVIIATSGKALLLVKTLKDGQFIIQTVTHRALKEAAGIDICGVISEPFQWSGYRMGEMNRQVHERFESVRSRCPSPELRFPRLPIIDECATSGLPAAWLDPKAPNGITLRSEVSRAKRKAEHSGKKRIQQTTQLRLADSLRTLDREYNRENDSDVAQKKLSWIGIVHADGNGLGQIFLNFKTHAKNNREYINKYRSFSIGLDICTENAFLTALETLPQGEITPIVPLILGGDDLTVLCDGQSSLTFTHKFLESFEAQTEQSISQLGNYQTIIRDIAQKTYGTTRLSACAGVAIVKSHFPFSVAYKLAEDLISSAKQVKQVIPVPCSALDFHVLYDTSNVSLENIRQKLIVDRGRTKLYGRPYIVTDIAKLPALDWVEPRQWKHLQERLEKLKAKDDDDRRILPSSQMHDLRAGLFLGQAPADARYKLIRDRYPDLRSLAVNEESLFWQETTDQMNVTGFLDAMDALSLEEVAQ
ncbi:MULTISPECIES: Cas10/Cmr2 second palm domain-containing protein [Leptolyngbya]|uniref:Cas10/Cmr2 second palm domain-containing protein n=1 Tax=Leptolyngbya TaxID=47251 RepID=UPI0016881FD9|nr:hypothetical protein [Leptolyngbya sp. FACHB-1624]MBD1858245.1 hypothetical protein [Leptolyngbya sp. FACHB-1624]